MVMHRTSVGEPEPADTDGDTDVVNRYPGTGVTTLLVALSVVAVLVVVFLAQNTESIQIDFLWLSAEAPLFVVLLSALCVGALGALLVGQLWRRRRRRQRSEREELARLRRERTA